MNIYNFVATPWFWFVMTIIFLVIEYLNGFVLLITIWFAISSFLLIFITWVAKYFSNPIQFKHQLLIFLLIGTVLLAVTRPIAIKKLKIGKQKTNIDSLIGKEALVLKKITEFDNGEIKIEGKIWTAKIEDGNEIEQGSKCIIKKIEGVKAIVSKV
jgi:membrane protein implicated in regulation of membrane protease activity